MSSEFELSMNQGKVWADLVIPNLVSTFWSGAELFRVEQDDHPACQLLDKYSGIDYLVQHKDALIGLSARIQGHRFYDFAIKLFNSPTFTIRRFREGPGYKVGSEYSKTLEAINRGGITAAYQLHAYVDVDKGIPNTITALGLAQRITLFKWIQHNPELCEYFTTQDVKRNQRQGFAAVPFNLLPDDILVYQQ